MAVLDRADRRWRAGATAAVADGPGRAAGQQLHLDAGQPARGARRCTRSSTFRSHLWMAGSRARRGPAAHQHAGRRVVPVGVANRKRARLHQGGFRLRRRADRARWRQECPSRVLRIVPQRVGSGRGRPTAGWRTSRTAAGRTRSGPRIGTAGSAIGRSSRSGTSAPTTGRSCLARRPSRPTASGSRSCARAGSRSGRFGSGTRRSPAGTASPLLPLTDDVLSDRAELVAGRASGSRSRSGRRENGGWSRFASAATSASSCETDGVPNATPQWSPDRRLAHLGHRRKASCWCRPTVRASKCCRTTSGMRTPGRRTAGALRDPRDRRPAPLARGVRRAAPGGRTRDLADLGPSPPANNPVKGLSVSRTAARS